MSNVTVRPLAAADEGVWRQLWTAYLAFYKTQLDDDVYRSTWARLFADGAFEPRGLIAEDAGVPLGLTHYLFHRSCWAIVDNCYLQDLYVAPQARGQGVGAALIAAVKAKAAERAVTNVYWMTHETNDTARRLYDHVARRTGFIEYDLL